MTDIVERLRTFAAKGAGVAVLIDAAAEIETLRFNVEQYEQAIHRKNEELAGLRAAAQSVTALRDYLVQIRNVCRDNATESCNHRMALDYVHQLAAAALSSAERGCICQEQHRRGYCTEPGCPHAQQERP